MMINNMNEFIKEHPHAVIVNYDIVISLNVEKLI